MCIRDSLSTVLDTTLDRLKGATIKGNNLQLTLHARAQRVALQALGSRCGAVVALEPDTGKVLVMASSPTYNPNDVEGNFNRATGTRADCKRPDALLNRATSGLYAPGSTFKVLTAAAAIDSGRFEPSSLPMLQKTELTECFSALRRSSRPNGLDVS